MLFKKYSFFSVWMRIIFVRRFFPMFLFTADKTYKQQPLFLLYDFVLFCSLYSLINLFIYLFCLIISNTLPYYKEDIKTFYCLCFSLFMNT